MSELAEDFKFLKEQAKLKRQRNAETSISVLQYEKLSYRVLNEENHHLLIENPGFPSIDFWPSTGKWKPRGTIIYGRGVKKLVSFIRKSRPQKTNIQRVMHDV